MRVSPYDLGIIAGEYVRVHHPSEDFFHKSATGRIALFSCCCTEGSKNGAAIFHVGPALAVTPRWKAPVDVLVPLSDARWNPFIEIARQIALWSGVQCPDQH